MSSSAIAQRYRARAVGRQVVARRYAAPMPLPVACLHHLDDPVLGHAGAALVAAGFELDERNLLRGDPLPRPDDVAGIVAFGGCQSVREIDRYPYLVSEAELLREAVARGLPVFGICLGGQLLAHALGAPV